MKDDLTKMNKKYVAPSLLFLSLMLALTSVFLFSNKALLNSHADPSNYEILFNNSQNKFFSGTGTTGQSGTSTVQTSLGNDIDFTYSNVAGGSSSSWHLVKADGYFYNSTPISGMSRISFTFTAADKEFKIYWSSNTEFVEERSQVFLSDTSTVNCNFDSYNPTHFKLVNTSGSNLSITSMNIYFTCVVGSCSLTLQSENETLGTVSGGGVFLPGQEVSVTANPIDGYKFAGWYCDSILVSTDNPYTFSMPCENTTYLAKFVIGNYTITLLCDSELGSTWWNTREYLFGDDVEIGATPKTGVSFLGWYNENDVLVWPNDYFHFTMPGKDLTYTAKFAAINYSMNVVINDNSIGSVTGGGTYFYNQEVNLVAIPHEHCSFFGWFNSEELVSKELSLAFNMPDHSLNYEARFVRNYQINAYSDNESMGTITAPTEWGAGLEVTVIADNSNYALDCWTNENYDEVSYDPIYTFVMPEHDVELIAFFDTGYTLTLASADESKGTVSGTGKYKEGRNITVLMNCLSGKFKGWFDSNNVFVSESNPYIVTMPSHDHLLEGRFMTQEECYGISPVVSSNGKTVTYGLYPQKYVNDYSVISILNNTYTPEPNGWYLYNGDYYAKLIATPISNYIYFDNGTKINKNDMYWFKCEPIVWNILQVTSGKYFLLSSIALDAHCYCDTTSTRTIDGNIIYPNNYEYSNIRTWLNSDFYGLAFSLGDNYIKTTLVDNSAATTRVSNNRYICKNTQDKVFLLSYQDYVNNSYGFSTSAGSTNTRYCKTTDWARARGVGYAAPGFEYQYCCNYWMRTPDSIYSDEVLNVRSDGSISETGNISSIGVRPSICIANL